MWFAVFQLVTSSLGVLVLLVIAALLWTFRPRFVDIKCEGKTVLVTGAGSGIGLATTKLLLSKGCNVVACDINTTEVEPLKATYSDRLSIFKTNVTKQEDLDQVFDSLKKQKSSLYGILNSAGIDRATPTTDHKSIIELSFEKEIFPVIDVNLFGTIKVNQTFFPLILESRGCIVNLASVLARVSLPRGGPYAMSKHAISAYTQTFRREVEHLGVRVRSIDPSWVNTRMAINALQEEKDFSKSVAREGLIHWTNVGKSEQNSPAKWLSTEVIAQKAYESMFTTNSYPQLMIAKTLPALIQLQTVCALPYEWIDMPGLKYKAGKEKRS